MLPVLERGTLVHVLPEYRLESLPVWAATPHPEGSEAAKVRVAVDYLRRHFTTLPALGLASVAPAS